MSKGFSILGNRKDISNPMTSVIKVSADLAAIIGKDKASFFECYYLLKAYIKKNNLKDPENKQYFTPDKKMAKIFGSDSITIFSITKVINKHFPSTLKLEHMPEEVILKIFSNLQIPDLIRCGEVSKRIRRIADDETLCLRG
jgi:chromatin remodeling complex protein RSC6